jgi:hypothetical protein
VPGVVGLIAVLAQVLGIAGGLSRRAVGMDAIVAIERLEATLG